MCSLLIPVCRRFEGHAVRYTHSADEVVADDGQKDAPSLHRPLIRGPGLPVPHNLLLETRHHDTKCDCEDYQAAALTHLLLLGQSSRRRRARGLGLTLRDRSGEFGSHCVPLLEEHAVQANTIDRLLCSFARCLQIIRPEDTDEGGGARSKSSGWRTP